MSRRRLFSIRSICIATLCIAIAVAVSCAAVLVYQALIVPRNTEQSISEYRNIRQEMPDPTELQTPSASDSEPQITPDNTPSQYSESDMLPVFKEMYTINNDIIGWLNIPSVDVDHPVFYTPENQNYYLNRAPDGTRSSTGSLFMSKGSEINPQANVLVIYGHKMRNGTMFGKLTRYKKLETLVSNPTFTFDTLYEQGTWKIIAAATTSIDMDANDFYYLRNSYASEEEFYDFLKKLRMRSLFIIDDDGSYEDRYLILSTCDATHFKNQRFIVVARRLRSDETTDMSSCRYIVNDMPLMPLEYYARTGNKKPSDDDLWEHYTLFYGE